MREETDPRESVIWKAGATAAAVVGLLWLCGYPVSTARGFLGGPDGQQAWFEPGSAEPVTTAVETALR